MLRSCRCSVSEHNSTLTRTATWSGHAEVVGQPGDAGGPGHAAEPEHRDPLDVGTQAEPIDESGVDARCGDARDAREQHMVHVPGLQARRIQCGLDGVCGDIRPDLDEGRVGLSEGQTVVPLHWEREPASAHLDGLVELGNPADVVVLLGPRLLEGCDQLILLVAMRRMGCGDGQDLHAAL